MMINLMIIACAVLSFIATVDTLWAWQRAANAKSQLLHKKNRDVTIGTVLLWLSILILGSIPFMGFFAPMLVILQRDNIAFEMWLKDGYLFKKRESYVVKSYVELGWSNYIKPVLCKILLFKIAEGK